MKLINAILINIIYMKFERLMFNSMDCWTVTLDRITMGPNMYKVAFDFYATIQLKINLIKASPCIYKRTK